MASTSLVHTRTFLGMLMGVFALAMGGAVLAADPDFHLYLLVGQSNMAGRGALDAESKEAHPRVVMLTKDLQWVPAVDPVHFDKPIAAVGPGIAFGKVMAEASPGVKIGLIPCAVGGSKIEEWAPGKKNYTDMLERVKAAQKAGVLKGILWHQGESNLKEHADYAERLTALVSGMRTEFSAPEVPVVVGEITAFKPGTVEKFNAMLHAAAKTIPRCACVETRDLKDKGDRLHYDTASARELGRRYAKAMLVLQKQ